MNKGGEDSFSRSDKEDGGNSPNKEDSPPKEENANGEGDDGNKKEGSRSRSNEGGDEDKGS